MNNTNNYEGNGNGNGNVEEFKKIVKKWLSIDDDIKRLAKASKALKKERDALSKPIQQFMIKNEIENCNTSGGKLKCTVIKTKKPINRQYIKDKLSIYFQNQKQSDAITSFIYENRDHEEKIKLSRIAIKNNNNNSININQ